MRSEPRATVNVTSGASPRRHVGLVVVALRIYVALGFGLVLMAAAAWGQNRDRVPNDLFHVTWAPRALGVAPTIEGHVHNDSTLRVTDVRLQVEGLDADSRPVGQRFAWALGDIVPGGETSFVIETIPGAVNYRITVISYDVVSVSQAP